MSSFRFLGVNITVNLSWSSHSTTPGEESSDKALRNKVKFSCQVHGSCMSHYRLKAAAGD